MTSLLKPDKRGGADRRHREKPWALPNAMESFPTLAHPLANKVGWFGLTNIGLRDAGSPARLPRSSTSSACSARSRRRKCRPMSTNIRKPRGRTVLEEKTHLGARASQFGKRGSSGPVLFSDDAASALAGARRRFAIVMHDRGVVAHPGWSIVGSAPRGSHRTLDTATSNRQPIWYYHLPNFVLAAVDCTPCSADSCSA